MFQKNRFKNLIIGNHETRIELSAIRLDLEKNIHIFYFKPSKARLYIAQRNIVTADGRKIAIYNIGELAKSTYGDYLR